MSNSAAFDSLKALCFLTYSSPGKLTLMFALLILPGNLPHLEVYEQALSEQVKTTAQSPLRIIQVTCMSLCFSVVLAHWIGEVYLLFAST